MTATTCTQVVYATFLSKTYYMLKSSHCNQSCSHVSPLWQKMRILLQVHILIFVFYGKGIQKCEVWLIFW